MFGRKDERILSLPVEGQRGHDPREPRLTDLLPVLNMTLGDEARAACDALVPPGGVVTNFHSTAGWMKTTV